MTGYVNTDDQNAQIGPWPAELADLVERCEYRDGWDLLLRNEVRDPASTHGTETAGLTLTIITSTVNSYPPHQPMRVRHFFPVATDVDRRTSFRGEVAPDASPAADDTSP